MSTHKGYALLAILAAAVATGTIPAFAANELACPSCVEGGYDKLEAYKKLLPIVIWTDKTAYDQQSTIVVSGHVRNPNPDTDVTIKVIGPTGNVVKVEQLTVDSNGDFETTFNTASPLWTQSGVYTITAQYGGASKTDRVQIEVLGETSTTCDLGELEAKVGNSGYCIPYTVSGATVVGGTLNTGTKSLIVKIMTESQGEITLDIPRSVLDSKSGGRDDSFFVLVDEEETDYDENTTPTTRSVTIQFLAGAEEIEIIGTQIVPEFGPIAALVLAVAIISIIAVSAKTRLRLMPKY
ncbi:MAG: PEFG-CTERM sorting domain-containing protein, partial [Nitrososphaerota archaeon]